MISTYIPDIDWDTLSVASHSSQLFCDFVFNNNFCQLIDKPTHVKGNVLDLILTNCPHHVQEISISSQDNYMQSDHSSITFQLTDSVLPQVQATSRYVFDSPKAMLAFLPFSWILTLVNYSPLMTSISFGLLRRT